MRQFYLVNKDGQRYQLINDFSKAFLWQPSGLGFGIDRDYKESDGFFFEMNKEVAQTAKSGTLVFFGPDPYPEYKAFMDYITHSEDLKLAYCPKSNWYYVDIDIESVEKTEIEQDGTLQCSINMLPKTPLYLPYEMNIDLSGDLGTSIKQYDYKYAIDRWLMEEHGYIDGSSDVKFLGVSTTTITDGGTETPTIVGWSDTVVSGNYVYYSGYFVWGLDSKWHTISPTSDNYWYKYSNTAVAGEIEFVIPAQMDSGLEITIPGQISSPVMTFYANGEIIGQIDLSSISVSLGEYVRYSSIPLSAGIYMYSGGSETDITAQIGLSPSYPTFFLLPPNKTIKAVLQADVLTGTTAALKVYEYFYSV